MRFLRLVLSVSVPPLWGIIDTEIKVPSGGNWKLSKVLPVKPGVGQN